MVLFNYSTKELTAKIVYYGPGLCGKTTNLQYIHQNLPQTVKGKMLSLATKTDRTLFFDFLPIDLGEIRGMQTRVQLYTVPGQVFYNETRKLVLKGADGIVFVADSQKQMIKANIESFKNLEDNLRAHGLNLAEMPHVIQYNKRDLPKLASIDELNKSMNQFNAPFYESVATTGVGVQDSLKAITKLVLLHLTKKYDPQQKGASQSAKPKAKAKAKTEKPAAEVPNVTPAVPEVASVPMAAIPTSAPAGDAAAGMQAAAPAASAASADAMTATLPPVDEVYLGEPEQDSVGNDGTDTAPVVAATSEAPSLEFDQQADPEWNPEATIQSSSIPGLEAAAPEMPAASGGTATATKVAPAVTLTDAVGDQALFQDPSMQIAQLATGAGKTIVVPVEMGDAETGTKRYKLSIRLCLDPVED